MHCVLKTYPIHYPFTHQPALGTRQRSIPRSLLDCYLVHRIQYPHHNRTILRQPRDKRVAIPHHVAPVVCVLYARPFYVCACLFHPPLYTLTIHPTPRIPTLETMKRARADGLLSADSPRHMIHPFAFYRHTRSPPAISMICTRLCSTDPTLSSLQSPLFEPFPLSQNQTTTIKKYTARHFENYSRRTPTPRALFVEHPHPPQCLHSHRICSRLSQS